MTIRLGVIGFSEGNGHPYSWSAIINGYAPAAMADSGFPVIPEYLARQRWPDARIAGAEVTHVWTQDPDLSQRIARAALIPNVVPTPEAMIGQVDAILLARDDAENHAAFALPFIDAGLPIYIDKPIALSLAALHALHDRQHRSGQIFTCSALRYARELTLPADHRERIGRIRHIQATTPNSWEKYAVHIIEPVLRMLDAPPLVQHARSLPIAGGGRQLVVGFADDVTASLAATGKGVVAPIAIRVHGERGWLELGFADSFAAFRSALQDFIDGIRAGDCRSPFEFNRQVVSIIEAGLTT